MFDSRKTTNHPCSYNSIVATQTGVAYPIEEMPDAVFADKILGDGVCIVPHGRYVYSPVDGTVVNVSEVGYAFSICGDDGAEVMVHIGVDTVKMPGGTFSPQVKSGQRIHRGDLLCLVDLQAIEQAGFVAHTALVMNMTGFEIVRRQLGKTKGGKSVVFCYRKRKPAQDEK